MACDLLTRLFRRGRRQLPNSSSQAPAPPVPTLEKSSNQLSLSELIDQDDADFFFLGCLSEQGSYSLTITDIPSTTNTTDLNLLLTSLPGFTALKWNEKKTGTQDVIIDFATAAEAAMALATHPTFDLGSGIRRALQYADIEASEPSRKKMKTAQDVYPEMLPRCMICCTELDGPYVKPCFYCKWIWCYDCVKSDFKAVLEAPERFPARCCGRVKHYDTARGIVPTSDYTKYRSRFEEFSTVKPLYCANPACSAFLPLRISKPDDKGRVLCPNCQATTCCECRTLVDDLDKDNHKCAGSQEATDILVRFGYKRCPRCNTGVARMFGCSHMRCQCGASYCWDCLRPIQMCWSKPCERSREDGNETDEYDIPEPEPEFENEDIATAQTDNEGGPEQPAVSLEGGGGDAAEVQIVVATTTELPALPADAVDAVNAVSSTPPLDFAETSRETEALMNIYDAANHIAEPTYFETPADAPVCTAVVGPAAPIIQIEPATNLDASDQGDWEGCDYDFGSEPTDESWDTWGCLHHFSPVASISCKEWFPISTSTTSQSAAVERHVDCLRCYKTIILEELSEKQKDMGTTTDDKKRTDSACSFTSPTDTLGTTATVAEQLPASEVVATVTDTGRKAKKLAKRQKKPSEIPKLFNCPKCGVLYCPDCKKAAAKEIAAELKRTTRA